MQYKKKTTHFTASEYIDYIKYCKRKPAAEHYHEAIVVTQTVKLPRKITRLPKPHTTFTRDFKANGTDLEHFHGMVMGTAELQHTKNLKSISDESSFSSLLCDYSSLEHFNCPVLKKASFTHSAIKSFGPSASFCDVDIRGTNIKEFNHTATGTVFAQRLTSLTRIGKNSKIGYLNAAESSLSAIAGDIKVAHLGSTFRLFRIGPDAKFNTLKMTQGSLMEFDGTVTNELELINLHQLEKIGPNAQLQNVTIYSSSIKRFECQSNNIKASFFKCYKLSYIHPNARFSKIHAEGTALTEFCNEGLCDATFTDSKHLKHISNRCQFKTLNATGTSIECIDSIVQEEALLENIKTLKSIGPNAMFGSLFIEGIGITRLKANVQNVLSMNSNVRLNGDSKVGELIVDGKEVPISEYILRSNKTNSKSLDI